MATIDELHELLRKAATTLDDAARQIRDIPMEPPKENIRRIGKALGKIHDIEREIYRLCPDLMPEELR